MAFQRERFLLRCVAAVIGVRLLASLAVIVVCLGGWSASRKACGDALEGLDIAFETALATALALLSSSGLRTAERRQRAEEEEKH